LLDPEGGKYGLGIVDLLRYLGRNASVIEFFIPGSLCCRALPAREWKITDLAINTGESLRSLTEELMTNIWISLSQELFKHQDIDPSS